VKELTTYQRQVFLFFASTLLLTITAAVYFNQLILLAVPFAILFIYYSWQHFSFVFFLLLAALPWSVEYNFTPSLGTDLPDEPLMILLAGFSFTILAVYPQKINKQLLNHPLMILLTIHLLWIIISALFSTHPLLSLKFLAAKFWYAGAFVFAGLILFNNTKNIILAGKLFAISMTGVVLLILARHFQHGFSFATINHAVSPFFRNHVNYSAMLVCIIPVLGAFFYLTKRKELKWLLFASLIICLTALFLSFARGAWLALVTGLIAVLLIRFRVLVKAFVLSIIICIAAVLFLKSNDRYIGLAHNYQRTIFHSNFNEHLSATYAMKDISTAERYYRWIAGIRMVKENWLHGHGPATFYSNYKEYSSPLFRTWVSGNKEKSTIHNYFLMILIEQGVPGLLFFLLLAGGMLYYAEKLFQKTNDRFIKTAAAAIASIVVMILTANFFSDLIETDKIGSIFFLCLTMLVILSNYKSTANQTLQDSSRP
jgi:O-antigen ligase